MAPANIDCDSKTFNELFVDFMLKSNGMLVCLSTMWSVLGIY